MPETGIRLFDRNLPGVDLEEATRLAHAHFAVDGELHALDGEREVPFIPVPSE